MVVLQTWGLAGKKGTLAYWSKPCEGYYKILIVTRYFLRLS
jgi:hypothetical protein